RPNLSAMPVDDALHGSKSDAGAWKLLYGVQALEGPEKAVRIARVDPGAVVAHEKRMLLFFRASAEFDPGSRMAGGVLPGITQQVFHRRAQQLRIAHGG